MRAFLCALALALCAPAWADVVYHWKTIDGPDEPLIGQLIVTDAAYRAGSVDYFYDAIFWADAPDGSNDPNAPVIELGLQFIDGVGVINRFRDGGTGVEDERSTMVSLVLGANATGSFNTGGGEVDLAMSSGADGIWSIELFMDWGRGRTIENCLPFDPHCTGVTGRWVLDASTVPVSLPGTLALLAAPLLLTVRAARSATAVAHFTP